MTRPIYIGDILELEPYHPLIVSFTRNKNKIKKWVKQVVTYYCFHIHYKATLTQ